MGANHTNRITSFLFPSGTICILSVWSRLLFSTRVLGNRICLQANDHGHLLVKDVSVVLWGVVYRHTVRYANVRVRVPRVHHGFFNSYAFSNSYQSVGYGVGYRFLFSFRVGCLSLGLRGKCSHRISNKPNGLGVVTANGYVRVRRLTTRVRPLRGF